MPTQIEYTKGVDEHGFVYRYTQLTLAECNEVLGRDCDYCEVKGDVSCPECGDVLAGGRGGFTCCGQEYSTGLEYLTARNLYSDLFAGHGDDFSRFVQRCRAYISESHTE